MDSAGSDRTRRRTGTRQIQEIAPLSETRRSDERSWCWLHTVLELKQEREMHESGVGFAIITGLDGKLSGLPKGIDRPMTPTLPLSGNQHASIISAYSITMTSHMKSTISSTMVWILFKRHVHPSRWLKHQSWHKLPGLGWSDRISGHRHAQQ